MKSDQSSDAETDGQDRGVRVAITGAASGIGRATAMQFAALGARMALLDLDTDALAALETALPGKGHLSLSCDVSVRGQVREAFSRIAECFGRLDVLVNNAGINPSTPSTAEIDDDFYDRIMAVNVKGVFLCAQAAIELLAAAPHGAIVNLGSVSGMIGWGGSSIYSASKGAVMALTRYLAIEYAPRNVRVNAVCPGSIRTPMVEQNLALLADPVKAWEQAAALHPIGRIGTPEEVADAIFFLASPQSSFITGSCLVIDGGLTAI